MYADQNTSKKGQWWPNKTLKKQSPPETAKKGKIFLQIQTNSSHFLVHKRTLQILTKKPSFFLVYALFGCTKHDHKKNSTAASDLDTPPSSDPNFRTQTFQNKDSLYCTHGPPKMAHFWRGSCSSPEFLAAVIKVMTEIG